MYWYNQTNKGPVFLITGLILLLGFTACKNDRNSAKDTMTFFDLKGYFKADSARLSQLNPMVNKTVVHNKITETQKLHIPNWGAELSLFSESDINKPAWKESYSISTTDSLLIYRAKDPTLKTREIIVKRDGNKVKWIMIFNYTKNVLYETTEKLSYFPDSLYLIQKRQRVRVLGTDNYKIRGAFN